MATLQVRSLDDQLYEALGKRAMMQGRSISQEVVMILKDYLSQPNNEHQNATEQFLDLCGTWEDERSSAEITAELRNSRVESSRFKDDMF